MTADSGGDSSTGRGIAYWRHERGLSQSDVARAAGLSRSTYWRLETGRTWNPQLRQLVNISKVLRCPNGVIDLLTPEWQRWHAFDRTNAATPPDPPLWQR